MPLETSYKANATPSQILLRKLEELEEETSRHSSLSGSSRWMIPYADMLTLLLGFFMVMYASLQMDHQTLKTYTQNVQKSLSSSSDPSHLTANNSESSPALPSPQKTSSQKQTIQKQQEDLEALMSEIKTLERETQHKATSSSIPFTVEADGLNYLQAELQAEFDPDKNQQTPFEKGTEISQQSRGLIISLKEGVLFEPGTAALSPKAQKTLDHLAKVLKKMSRPIRVEGHTDNTPIATKQYPSNWELSTSRATHIIKYFITQHHFPADKLSAAGYGEFKPITNNSTIEGKQKNRRVDIVVLNPQSTQEEPQQEFKKRENFKNSEFEENNLTPMVSNDVSPPEPHEITQEKMIHHGTTH